MLVHVAMPQANERVRARAPRSSRRPCALMARARRAAPPRSVGKALESRTFSPHKMSVRATSSAVPKIEGAGLEVAVAEQGVVARDVHQLARPLPDGPSDEPDQGLSRSAALWRTCDAHQMSPCWDFAGDRPANRTRLWQRCFVSD